MAFMAAVVTGAVVLAFCIPLAVFVRSVAYDRAIDNADLEARSLAAELSMVNSAAALERLLLLADGAADTTPATVYLRNGQIFGRLRGTPGAVPRIVRVGLSAETAMPGGDRGVWEPVRKPSAAAAVLVRVPSSLLTKGVAREWLLLFGGGLLLVLIAIALADWMGRFIVRPISDLEAVTRQLSNGDLERRVVPGGPYEVTEVGRAVNELADRIDSLLASARMTGADLGHRLRTPLTAMRLNIESLGDSTARAALAKDFDVLEAAVNRLILETREPPAPPSHADLAGATRDRMSFWAVLAKSQNRPFGLEAPTRRVEVGLDKAELEAAIDALVSNIFAHTPEGTAFRVGLRQSTGGSAVWALVVEDDGPPPSVLPATSAVRETGTGLGLDIVRRTAERAGGSVKVGRSKAGGFRVELKLPEILPPEPNREAAATQRG